MRSRVINTVINPPSPGGQREKLFSEAMKNTTYRGVVNYMGVHLGVSKNRGTPKWMVKTMENPIKMDDLGVNTIFGNIHMGVHFFWGVITNTLQRTNTSLGGGFTDVLFLSLFGEDSHVD